MPQNSTGPAEQLVVTSPNTYRSKRDLVASLPHPSSHPQSLALRDLPHNQQVVEFSSIPDLILNPVRTVNVFIECNVSRGTGIRL